MDKVPGMLKNAPVAQQVVEIAPIVVELQGCNFMTRRDHDANGDPQVHITFVHQSGVVAFHCALSEAAKSELVRQLTGGIAVPGVVV